MARLRVIAGLGNPGPEYAATRHNAGFWLADALAREQGAVFQSASRFQADLVRLRIDGEDCWLVKPHTYMNRSGGPVGAVLRYYRIEPSELLVAYDELDLAPGVARLKFDGGHGGHNGLKDLFAHLGGGGFNRLRLGIGHPGHKDQVTSWVLGRPGAEQERAINAAIDDALMVLPLAISGDINGAMKRLHTPAATPGGG